MDSLGSFSPNVTAASGGALVPSHGAGQVGRPISTDIHSLAQMVGMTSEELMAKSAQEVALITFALQDQRAQMRHDELQGLIQRGGSTLGATVGALAGQVENLEGALQRAGEQLAMRDKASAQMLALMQKMAEHKEAVAELVENVSTEKEQFAARSTQLVKGAMQQAQFDKAEAAAKVRQAELSEQLDEAKAETQQLRQELRAAQNSLKEQIAVAMSKLELGGEAQVRAARIQMVLSGTQLLPMAMVTETLIAVAGTGLYALVSDPSPNSLYNRLTNFLGVGANLVGLGGGGGTSSSTSFTAAASHQDIAAAQADMNIGGTGGKKSQLPSVSDDKKKQ